MKKDELIAAASKAKIEINDQIDEFIESLEQGTADPEHFASFSEIEAMWRNLKLGTHKTYSDMMKAALSSLDTQEVNDSKKGHTSRKE
ncbi:MAG: hypothetical protein IJ246_03485 [Clostridia bacterium]|nr:hypothetical protein [Clostridia bacterium]